MASKREMMKKKNKNISFQLKAGQVSNAVNTIIEKVEFPIEETTPSEEVESPVEETIPPEEVESPVEETTPSEEVESSVEETIPPEEVESPVEETISSEEVESPIEEKTKENIQNKETAPVKEYDTISAKKLYALPKIDKAPSSGYDISLKIKRTNVHVSAEFKRRFEKKMSDYLLIHARTPKEQKMSTSKFISALMHMYVAKKFEDIYMYDGYFEDQKKEELVSFLDFVSPVPAEAKDQVIGTDLPMEIAIEIKSTADLYGISVAALLTSCLYTFIITPFNEEEEKMKSEKENMK